MLSLVVSNNVVSLQMQMDYVIDQANSYDTFASFAAYQDGTFYLSSPTLLTATTSSWRTHTQNLVISDFHEIIFDGTNLSNPMSTIYTGPSAAGVEFGMFIFSEGLSAGNLESKYDNVRVNVESVSEPASMLTLAIRTLVSLKKRRNRAVYAKIRASKFRLDIFNYP